MLELKIREYNQSDRDSVVELWRRCDLLVPQNNPHHDIECKLKHSPELFFVGLVDQSIIASCMAGYEGHRGWINYLAVDPSFQRKGIAATIMRTAEEKLLSLGCVKVNLQIRETNINVIQFYQSIGYKIDASVSMGKRIQSTPSYDIQNSSDK
ncbi:GNAT family acetyltransferase [bacterium]|nr:GNAT family acetyltransferase [bacterium]